MKNNALEELKAWADKYNIYYDCWDDDYHTYFMICGSDEIMFFSKEGKFIRIE